MKKKALLIGIQNVRQNMIQITQENDERAAEDSEEDVHIASKRKKKKAQKERAPKSRGPHRDVLEMEQLLIGALYHDSTLFLLPAKGILAVV